MESQLTSSSVESSDHESQLEDEHGFIQITVEWGELLKDIDDELLRDAHVEVIQGPNIELLRLFIEEAPSSQFSAVPELITSPSRPTDVIELADAPRPILDKRMTQRAKNPGMKNRQDAQS